MIALVVSSLLVGLILAIFLRLSFAYRTQQQVASVQQVLAAGGAALQLDAQHAGAYMGPRFGLADLSIRSAVRVVDSSNGPDEVGFYYADPSAKAHVAPAAVNKTLMVLDVDTTTGFAQGDVVVMSTAVIVQNPGAPIPPPPETITKYYSCVLQIESLTPTQFTFSQNPPWGRPNNDHCASVIGAPDAPPPGFSVAVPNDVLAADPAFPPPAPPPVPIVGVTQIYKLVARYYKIDAARPGEGVLQVSPTGNLIGANDWRDLGYGFTDLQIALRFYLSGDVIDDDLDLDAERDWVSGPNLDIKTAPGASLEVPIAMNISLVARTERDVEGIATVQTPVLLGAPASFNSLGNHDFVDLTTTGDPTLQGQRIYRFTSFRVDLRNLGIGR
jgi:hypothetical protein